MTLNISWSAARRLLRRGPSFYLTGAPESYMLPYPRACYIVGRLSVDWSRETLLADVEPAIESPKSGEATALRQLVMCHWIPPTPGDPSHAHVYRLARSPLWGTSRPATLEGLTRGTVYTNSKEAILACCDHYEMTETELIAFDRLPADQRFAADKRRPENLF